MLLGQMVAISVALALFLAALSLRPAIRPTPYAPPSLYLPLFAAIVTIFAVPTYVKTEHFLTNLLWMHGLLLIPLISWHPKKDVTAKRGKLDIHPTLLYCSLVALAVVIHAKNAREVIKSALPGVSVGRQLYNQMFSHPAQASISLDVVWVTMVMAFWWMTTGAFAAVVLKVILLAGTAGLGVISFTGINWTLAASIVPVLLLLVFGVVLLGFSQLRKRNSKRRKELLDKMKILDNEVIPGTDKRPPSKSSVKTLVGFFHPYW
jgi:alpha-1,2-mannosyltransferase